MDVGVSVVPLPVAVKAQSVARHCGVRVTGCISTASPYSRNRAAMYCSVSASAFDPGRRPQ